MPFSANDYCHTLRLDKIETSLPAEISQNCGTDIERCMECGKCSGGCSNTHIFDFTPRKIIQLIKLGREEVLLQMDALWTCISCQLCVDRCPSEIDIARIMDYLREKAIKRGFTPTRENVLLFHRLMLDSINKTGRVAESALMLKYNLQTGQYLKDVDLGMKMFFKGKLNPFPSRVKKTNEVRRIFKYVAKNKEAGI